MYFYEFVGFIAACMALNALSIDIMLPALPDLNVDFALQDPNRSQAVIAIYLVGMGLSQIFYGPLSDRFGRRPVLIGGLALFSLAGLLSAFTQSFSMLLAARFVQGAGAGAPRVVAISLARDTYSGQQLARVLSLAVMLFMAVPILAPSVGQLILLVAPWRWVFGALVLGGGAMLAWTLLRLEESLPVHRRRSISPAAVFDSFRITITTRAAMGYTLALGLVMGAQMGFIISAQRIFMDVFGTGGSFTLLFALIALAMSVAAFTNSRLVLRFGMRHLVIVGLGALIVLNTAHLALVWSGTESLAVFMLMQASSMFLFGFLGPNLNTLAIEPLGHVAGTGSSTIGFFTTLCGALLGFCIGQLFNGSVVPLTLAYVVLGLTALAIVMRTERRGGSGTKVTPSLQTVE